MEYQNIAQSITDLNLIQGQEQDFLTLCRLLNVDSRIMGYVKGSTFSNMNEAKKDFLQNRILPLKYMEAEAYNIFVLPAFSERDNKKYYLDVDTKAIPELQVDTDKLSLRLQNEIKSGILKPAEAAKLLGYPELSEPEANQLWVATNIIPMNKAGQNKPNTLNPDTVV
jgi:phage portal protein BeeE